METWDQDFLDLVGPARITFVRGGRGEIHFGAVDLTLDWRAPAAGGRVEFTFEGFDEGDEVSGRGWAKLDGDRLTGKILFHMGETASAAYAEGARGKATTRRHRASFRQESAASPHPPGGPPRGLISIQQRVLITDVQLAVGNNRMGPSHHTEAGRSWQSRATAAG